MTKNVYYPCCGWVIFFLFGTAIYTTDATLKHSISFSDEREKTGTKERDTQLVCDIGDGITYNEGDAITSFETRCGSKTDFPCFCSPGLDPPISCPYCGFHSPETENNNMESRAKSNASNFFCLKVGEYSDPFVDTDTGATQVCACRIANNKAVSSCQPTSLKVEGSSATAFSDFSKNVLIEELKKEVTF